MKRKGQNGREPAKMAAELPALDPESVIMPDWAPPWEGSMHKPRVTCAISIERITQRIQKAGGAKIDAVLRVRLSDPVEIGDTMTQIEGLVQLLKKAVEAAQRDESGADSADLAHSGPQRAAGYPGRVSIKRTTKRVTEANRRLDASVKGTLGDVSANLRVIAPENPAALDALDELLFEIRQNVRTLKKGE